MQCPLSLSLSKATRQRFRIRRAPLTQQGFPRIGGADSQFCCNCEGAYAAGAPH
jgi:hypothetical protein